MAPHLHILIMLAFLALWGLLLFGGFIFGQPNAEQTHRAPRPMRLGSSFVLGVAGWFWWFTQPLDTTFKETALFIALGMTCGFMGDVFMAGLIIPRKHRVFGGIGAFGIGHIAYSFGLLHYAYRGTFGTHDTDWIAWLGCLLLAFVLWYLVVFRPAPQQSALHLAALPYALLLASTTGLGLGLALMNSAYIAFALGAALFLLSDLLLAAQLFNQAHFRFIGDAVWMMYGPGQMLIVYTLPLITLQMG